MSGGSRSLPLRPSLRFLKLEAKRRLAAGEFPTLHDAQAAIAREHGLPSWAALKQACALRPEPESHALDQLRWVVSRFSAADAPGWTAPDENELRQHFDDRLLALIPPGALVEQTSKMAADLRTDLVVISQGPLEAQVQLAGLRYFAAADATPPHRLIGLQGFPVGDRITNPLVKAPPPPRTLGELPGEMAGRVVGLAEEACAELGLPALVLARGEPGRVPWVVAIGYANLGGADPGRLRPRPGRPRPGRARGRPAADRFSVPGVIRAGHRDRGAPARRRGSPGPGRSRQRSPARGPPGPGRLGDRQGTAQPHRRGRQPRGTLRRQRS